MAIATRRGRNTDAEALGLDFAPDGRRLVTASADGSGSWTWPRAPRS
jgi:hypothetical protein